MNEFPDLPAEGLPFRCSECDYCEEITGRIYTCTKMERPLILLPREMHRNRPTFCPRDPDYRPAVNIKKPR